ncbi:MAG TPA: VUT family protein [Micromonosporaceae bacterium]|nr:VUT family protein [Micromonosporaceae bacterium]
MNPPPQPLHRATPTMPAAVGPDRRPPVPAPTRSRRRRWHPDPRLAARLGLAGFVVLAAAANALTYHHPLVPVGFGLYATPIAFALLLLDAPLSWLHRRGGQGLVFAALLAATVASTVVGGYFGFVWGISALLAEATGWCLRRLGDTPTQRALTHAGPLLTLLGQMSLYAWLLTAVVPVTVPGQLLGTAEALSAVAVVMAVGRAVRARRHRYAGRHRTLSADSRDAIPAWTRQAGRARRLLAVIGALVVFAASVTAANWLTARYGLIPVGLGLTATAGTYAAGLCLLARDWVHDTAGRLAVLAAVAAGGVASAVMAGPRLAVASAVAFIVSELTDLAVYQPLRRRGWARAVVASNAVGAPVDTVLFLALAGFPIWTAVPGQLLAKATATAVPVAAVLLTRAVLRHRQRTEGT